MAKKEKKQKKEDKSKKKKSSKRKGSSKEKDLAQRKKEATKKATRQKKIAKDKEKRYKKRKKKKEFEVRIVSIRRVSKVKAGGRRMRLSVMVVIGDRRGGLGIAVAKGKDVRTAQGKAINKAKKRMIKVKLKGRTIPHEITQKYKAAKVMLKPASPGTGVIAGGAVRQVVEVAGVKDVLTKQLGTNSAITNTYATFEALKNLRLKRLGQ